MKAPSDHAAVDAEQSDAPAALPAQTQRKARSFWRISLFTAILLAVVLACTPLGVANSPLMGIALDLIFADIDGKVSAKEASLGWFAPVVLKEVEVRDRAGKVTLTAKSFTIDRKLSELAADRTNLGVLKLESPRLRVEIHREKVNVAETFGRLFQPPAEKSGKKPVVIRGLQITDGIIELADQESGLKLQIDQVQGVMESPNPPLGLIDFQLSAEVTGFEPDHVRLVDLPVRLKATAQLDPQTDRLTFKGVEIRPKVGPLATQAWGEITDLSGKANLEVRGSLTYDLPQLADRLRPLVGGDLRMAGQGERPFHLSGPLAVAIASVTAKPTNGTDGAAATANALAPASKAISSGDATTGSGDKSHPTGPQQFAADGEAIPPPPLPGEERPRASAQASPENSPAKAANPSDLRAPTFYPPDAYRPRLADPAAAAPSNVAWLSHLTADMRLSCDALSVYGVQIGRANLAVGLRNGWVGMNATDVEISSGQVHLRTKYHLASTNPVFVVQPGRIVDRVRLTPEICAEGLKFIAPVLAESTRVEGWFSLDLAECRLPLDPETPPAVGGRLSIHSLDVGAGPLLQEIALLLSVEPQIRLVEESPVDFVLHEGRVYHQGLRFQLGALSVHTAGSVGLDQTVAMIVEIPVPEAWLGAGPIGQTLRGQIVRVPVGGTLEKPEVDLKALSGANSGLLAGTGGQVVQELLNGNLNLGGLGDLIGGVLERRREQGGVLDRFRNRNEAAPPPSGVAPNPREPQSPAPLFGGGFLDRLRERRQRRLGEPPIPAPNTPPPKTPPVKNPASGPVEF